MNRFSYTEIDEPVRVGAVFSGSGIKPRWFVWRKTKYLLRKITYTWIDNTRGSRHLCFSVWDGSNLYEISMDAKYLTWKLDKVYID